MDSKKIQKGFRLILEGLELDLKDEHIKNTPERAMRAWTKELCSGLGAQSFELTTCV